MWGGNGSLTFGLGGDGTSPMVTQMGGLGISIPEVEITTGGVKPSTMASFVFQNQPNQIIQPQPQPEPQTEVLPPIVFDLEALMAEAAEENVEPESILFSIMGVRKEYIVDEEESDVSIKVSPIINTSTTDIRVSVKNITGTRIRTGK